MIDLRAIVTITTSGLLVAAIVALFRYAWRYPTRFERLARKVFLPVLLWLMATVLVSIALTGNMELGTLASLAAYFEEIGEPLPDGVARAISELMSTARWGTTTLAVLGGITLVLWIGSGAIAVFGLEYGAGVGEAVREKRGEDDGGAP